MKDGGHLHVEPHTPPTVQQLAICRLLRGFILDGEFITISGIKLKDGREGWEFTSREGEEQGVSLERLLANFVAMAVNISIVRRQRGGADTRGHPRSDRARRLP